MDRYKLFCEKVEARSAVPDRIAAALLALTPILQHYQGLVYNAALTLLVLLVPYLLLRTVTRLGEYRSSNLGVVAVTVVYLIYRVVDHGTSMVELGQSGVLAIYMMAMAFGCVNVKSFCKVGLLISVLTSCLLLLQYIFFYLFRIHLQMVPTDLLLPSAEQWILGAQTGLAGVTGKMSDFYRPSAFFLEPSHVYIYLFPHLLLQLFGGKGKRSLLTAALITMGLVLSTSGMGIAFAVGSWGLYFIFHNEKDGTFSFKNVVRKKNLIMLGFLLVAFALAFFFVPTVKRTVTRIFVTKTGVNAIGGRIDKALSGLKNMTFLQWIIGVEDTTHGISYNMPGIMAALYRHGLIGMTMSADIYAKSVYRLKLPFAMTGAVILVTSLFSAHTHSTVGMLYFVLILMYGFQTQQRREGWLARRLQNRQ